MKSDSALLADDDQATSIHAVPARDVAASDRRRNEVTQAYPAPPQVSVSTRIPAPSLVPSPPKSSVAPLTPWRPPSVHVPLPASSWPGGGSDGGSRTFDDAGSPDDAAFPDDVNFRPAPQWRAIHWVLLFLVIATGGAFAVDRIRPDITERLAAAVRGDAEPTASVLAATSTPAASPFAASTQRTASPQTKTRQNPTGTAEPPLVSVWSLPVARGGTPASPPQAFHASFTPAPAFPALPARAPLFVPSVSFASSYAASMPNVASTPAAAAPATTVAPTPVSTPAPRAAPPEPAAESAPPVAPVATVAPPPIAAPPPPPPPKPKFAPGSLEDQIQKAVEAEAKKKQ